MVGWDGDTILNRVANAGISGIITFGQFLNVVQEKIICKNVEEST